MPSPLKDTEIIEKLAQKLPRKLKQMAKIVWFSRGYQVNEQNQVTHLSIFNMDLNGQWPAEVFQLQHLEYLDIRDNALATIPDSIISLQKLKCLDVRLNQLTSLPSAISQLPQLEKLYLAQNQFSSVPGTIAQCPTLELIDLTNNAITQGCEYLLEASTLKRIYLNNNQIKHFPFDNIIRPIEELNIGENPLESRPANKLIEKLFI